jgi:hypothetical protein
VTADLFGLLLPGLFRPTFSQLEVLLVHSESEKKKDQSRQKNSDPEQNDSLSVASLGSPGRKRIHPIIVSFSKTELS